MMYTHVFENRRPERTTAHDAEVSELKQSLERAQEELGRVKKQLEEKQGMFEHCLALGINELVCLLKSIYVIRPRSECRI